MTSPKTCILAAVAGVLSAQVAFADSADLTRQVNDLKAQVAALEARQAQDSKAVAATIESVLRDAEKRTQLLAADAGGAGYDNGFYIRTGAFSLQPGIIFQFRNVTDYRQDTGGAKDDEIENGFEVRMIDLVLQGSAFTKDLTYCFIWRTDPESEIYLLDAYVTYMFADAWGFRAGQFTANFTHEDFMGDGMQLAADRSLLDYALGGYTNRVQGVSLLYGNYNQKQPINAELAFHDGSNSINSNYLGHYPAAPGIVDGVMGPGTHAFDWGMYARVEWLASGMWANYADFSGINVKEDLFVLGGAVSYDQGGNGDLIGGTIDAQYKGKNGLTVYGAVVARYGDEDITGRGDEATDWGFLVQASYLVNPAWEVFARYTYINYDNEVVVGADDEDTFHEITLGVNYFLGNNGSAGHRAKVTIDLNILPNGLPGSFTNMGYLGDNVFETEVSLRGQFQLML
jgi:hypothetical protein